MRLKLFLLFLVVIATILNSPSVIARDEVPKQSQATRPEIHFEHTKYDFGKICLGEKYEYLFKFENCGNRKLIIHKVKTTCDCTTASVDSTEIEPGASGAIKVTYTASNKTGPFEKAVIVLSNDPDSPNRALLVRGEVMNEVISDPKFIDFGVILPGKSSAKSVKIRKGCNDQPPAKGWVTGVECDTPLVTASYKENGDDGYIIEASIKSDAQASEVQGNIFVLTSGLKHPRVKLPFYGRVGKGASDADNDAALKILFTGEENGYLEPCGCTEYQLGGISKRHTLIKSKIQNPESKNTLLVSLGDLTEGFGRQSEIKLETIVQALDEMGYIAHNIGEKDIALGTEFFDYLQIENSLKFLSSNVRFTDNFNTRIHSFLIKHAHVNGSIIKVGLLGVLSPDLAATAPSNGIKVTDPASALKPLIGVLRDRVDVLVLLSHAELEESVNLAEAFPALDLVISGHGIEELSSYEPLHVNDTTIVVPNGSKGKYAGVYKYYAKKKKGDVEIMPISSDYDDSPPMKKLMKHYLGILKDENLLANEPKIPTPTGDTFVGSKTCSICHKLVHKHWETTTHASAYETLVKSEHEFDPDCVYCHVTGFHYISGFESDEETPGLKGVGCEDCHGPGSAHINAPKEEYGKTTPEACATCHIPDHSPKFEYNTFWEKIVHPEEQVSGLGG